MGKETFQLSGYTSCSKSAGDTLAQSPRRRSAAMAAGRACSAAHGKRREGKRARQQLSAASRRSEGLAKGASRSSVGTNLSVFILYR
jgi:hypothetical protein